jgi:hypothetical protein
MLTDPPGIMWNDNETNSPKCSQATGDHTMEANWAVETVALTNALTFHCLELHYFSWVVIAVGFSALHANITSHMTHYSVSFSQNTSRSLTLPCASG